MTRLDHVYIIVKDDDYDRGYTFNYEVFSTRLAALETMWIEAEKWATSMSDEYYEVDPEQVTTAKVKEDMLYYKQEYLRTHRVECLAVNYPQE